jgi:hypothetical protein
MASYAIQGRFSEVKSLSTIFPVVLNHLSLFC